MADLQTSTFSETAGSNTAAAPDGFPEGMSYASVNNAARELMGAVKREWNRSHPTVTSGGTSTAITLTYTTAPPAYVQGFVFSFKVGTTCGDAPTLNVNALGAKKLYVMGPTGAVLAGSGDLTANHHAVVSYDTALDGGAGGFLVWQIEAGEMPISQLTASGTTLDFPIPALPYSSFRLLGQGLTSASNGFQCYLRSSTDGSTFPSGATDYTRTYSLYNGASSQATGSSTDIFLTASVNANIVLDFEVRIDPGNGGLGLRCWGTTSGGDGTVGTVWGVRNAAGRALAIRFRTSVTMAGGTLTLYGVR